MGVNRREFLKLAGASALFGVGGTTAFELLRPGQLEASSEVNHGAEGGHVSEAPTGKRLAMIVDVRKCIEQKGCDDCIKACHLTHNVPQIDSLKEEVKWIWKESFEHAFTSEYNEYVDDGLKAGVFPILCNHCDSPPCVRVCPTKATFRRAEDGVVMMDMHRCIGCRFCMAGCPYGARSFNWRDPQGYFLGKEDSMNPEYPTRTRGVVEKCTFCTERLAIGLLPACVEACQKRGEKGTCLHFGDLNDPNSEVRQILRTEEAIRRKPELGTKPSVFFLV
jgi:Fe-S-cluster-containing dehydrogenase component